MRKYAPPEPEVDTTVAFAQATMPDDRSTRVDLLRRYQWRYDKSTMTFYKNKYRILAGIVRLLPIADLEYSLKKPELVWPPNHNDGV